MCTWIHACVLGATVASGSFTFVAHWRLTTVDSIALGDNDGDLYVEVTNIWDDATTENFTC